MKVTYIGFGGGYEEYPCYEDEKGRIYFDLNDGRGKLNLYTGAYRHPEDQDICGEPNCQVTEKVECDNRFARNVREHDYRMLARYKADCDYFLGNGNGYEGHLYFKSVEEHCSQMQELYDSFSEDEKPEWLSAEDIQKYKAEMLRARRTKK